MVDNVEHLVQLTSQEKNNVFIVTVLFLINKIWRHDLQWISNLNRSDSLHDSCTFYLHNYLNNAHESWSKLHDSEQTLNWFKFDTYRTCPDATLPSPLSLRNNHGKTREAVFLLIIYWPLDPFWVKKTSGSDVARSSVNQYLQWKVLKYTRQSM